MHKKKIYNGFDFKRTHKNYLLPFMVIDKIKYYIVTAKRKLKWLAVLENMDAEKRMIQFRGHGSP